MIVVIMGAVGLLAWAVLKKINIDENSAEYKSTQEVRGKQSEKQKAQSGKIAVLFFVSLFILFVPVVKFFGTTLSIWKVMVEILDLGLNNGTDDWIFIGVVIFLHGTFIGGIFAFIAKNRTIVRITSVLGISINIFAILTVLTNIVQGGELGMWNLAKISAVPVVIWGACNLLIMYLAKTYPAPVVYDRQDMGTEEPIGQPIYQGNPVQQEQTNPAQQELANSVNVREGKKICDSCGRELKKGENFCMQCGNKVAD